jgi:hypothetical protein
MNIIRSVERYDAWLATQLKGDLMRDELDQKHDKMAADPFQFLRATYWRWAETIYKVCPELEGAPHVLAVGDLHVENFGSWRDAEGRLVWGVNDFDEAAGMPYPLDIVRLAVSAVLAQARGTSPASICKTILKGYVDGLQDPRPYVLDRHNEWLRNIVVVSDAERKGFWKKFDPKRLNKVSKNRNKPKVRPATTMRHRYVKALEAARPDASVQFEYFARTAGTGSLGRPRYFAVGHWRSDLIIREAKAIVRSGWSLAHGGSHDLRCEEIAHGKYRCPEPFYHLDGHILVRKLSPNDYKVEAKPKGANADESHKAVAVSVLVDPKMLHAMGRDLAAIHRGTPRRRQAIIDDLDARPARWLLDAVTAAARMTRIEWQEWRAYREGEQAKQKTASRSSKA